MTATAGTPENLKCFANSDLFEMRVYHTNPDRGDKIYFIHCLLWVSLPETTKSEACRNSICYLFCKTVLFSLSPCSSCGPIRGGALMKADSQPDAGCERWSKAGWTNVCTHTSTLSLPARGDVKHDDVGRSWRRALCLPLPSQEAQKILMRGRGFIRMNTREPSSHMHSNLNDNKVAHESNPGCDWNDHLFLANTANAGLFISLFCLVSTTR